MQGTLVPNNPAKATPPPSENKAGAVPNPGDMGGYNPDTLLPPAQNPVPAPEVPGLNVPDSPNKPDKPDKPDTPDNPNKPDNPDNPETPAYPIPTAILKDANAVITPLSSINAPGKTAHNLDDIIEIATKEALNAQLNAGTRTDGQPENDTLIISTNTAGISWRDPQGFIVTGPNYPLRVEGFESLILGEGSQQVELPLYNSYEDKELQHITFDHKDDSVSIAGPVKFKSVTNMDEGQGTIKAGSFDFTETTWNVSGNILLESNGARPGVIISAEALCHVTTPDDAQMGSLYTVGTLTAGENGTALLQDGKIIGADMLFMDTMTLGKTVRVLEGMFDQRIITMTAAQWAQMEKISRLGFVPTEQEVTIVDP